MSFARVDQKHADTHALGILVPQGMKTLVILRLRALAWDLLPARWDGDSAHGPLFCQFTREEASGAARRLVKSLEAGIEQGVNPVQTFGDAHGERLQIWLRTEEFVWIVCRRAPGLLYQPMIFQSQEEALQEAQKISAFVWPAVETRQEYYFNTQNFS